MKTVHLLLFAVMSAATASAQTNVGIATLTFPESRRADGPVWAHIQLPAPYTVQYPVGIVPDDFGCNEFEVRRNGVALPRIATDPKLGPPPPAGLPCGNIGIPYRPWTHPGRLPLHLQYKLEPGRYDVRYTRKTFVLPGQYQTQFQSAWTSLEIQAASSFAVGAPPDDAVEILSDYLPGILGQTDSVRLSAVVSTLYHPVDTVRKYAFYALAYWPEGEVQRRLTDSVRSRGASDVIVNRMLPAVPDLAEAMMAYLGANDRVLVGGALEAARKILSSGNTVPLFSDAAKARAADALASATENIIGVGDEQTVFNLASTLGTLPGSRSRDALWSFVNRRVAYEQALTAIAWHKDPADLPKLAAILESPVTGDPLSSELASLPYALRNAYGAAALPFLEKALQTSGYVFVQTACARELIHENRPAGFAFIVDAIEGNRRYKREMVDFMRSSFADLRGTDEPAVLAFAKNRSN